MKIHNTKRRVNLKWLLPYYTFQKMFAVCCIPVLARRHLVISNKAKEIIAGEETLLCTLELQNKNTSATIDDIRLDYELYARNSLVEEPNVAHCCISRISWDKCNIFINVSATTVVRLTAVTLDLGWKYKLHDNMIKFKVKTASPILSPVSSANSTKPDISALSMSGEYSPKLPKLSSLQRIDNSPVAQYSMPPSPTDSSFSCSGHHGVTTGQNITSYYLSHPQVSSFKSSVEAAKLPDGLGTIEAGTPIYFKVKVKDAEGEALPKHTKFKLVVKLGDETIFSGVTHKTFFKLTKTKAKQFIVLFYMNDEFIPGTPFYVNVLPLSACSIANTSFDEDSPRVRRYKSQSDALYVRLWMVCHADIVDKYGNTVDKNYEVKILTDPVIEVTPAYVQRGHLQFKARADEIGDVDLSFILKEDDALERAEILIKKEIRVKQLSMDDQFIFKSYV